MLDFILFNPLCRTVLWAIILYGVICAGLFVFQRSLIYFPQPKRTASTPSAWIDVGEAKLELTVRPNTGQKALLYFGGNAEDVSANHGVFSKLFPNYTLYLLHYRGYAGSTGKPSETALHQDATALFDHVYAKYSEILVIGRSLGSGVAIRLASHKPVSHLVLVTPYYSIQELAAQRFSFFPIPWLLQDKFESWRYADKISIPTTIITAGLDEVIPADSSKQLYAQFKPGLATYIEIPNVDHNTISSSPVFQSILQHLVNTR